MPRKSKKEDGDVNLHIIKNDTPSEEVAVESGKSTEETSILFLKNRVQSDFGNTEECEGDENAAGEVDGDLSKKRLLAIILRIFVFLLVAAAFGFGLKLASRSGCERCLANNTVASANCLIDIKKIETGLSIDKTRLSDAGNIVAGIQKYNYDKKKLPAKLTDMLAGNYISKEYEDPEFGKPYFYKDQNNGYVLCFYLSTGVWGINPSSCPSKENYLSSLPEKEPATPAPMKTVTVQKTSIGWLNIRQSATTDSAIIAKAYAGEQYKALEEKGDWIRIPLKSSVLMNGEQVIEGWVYKNYVK